MTESKEVKHYQVSGLDYTMPKMLTAMGLILIGYFAMTVSLGAVPGIVPLKLKELGLSNTWMVFIMSTLGQILNMTVCPWVSFKSDRYRSKRWGRRVPFILFTLPLLCLSWVIVGCYETEAMWLGKCISFMATLPQTTLAILVLAFGVVVFKFFYMFVGSVFYYIYYDVIPPQFLTRFNGALQITASAGSALYSFFVFPHALTHFRMIFLGIAVVYAVLMGIMCFFLKEPRFPEPDPVEKKKGKGLEGLKSFGKECFSHKMYIYEYINTTFTGAVYCAMMFTVFRSQSLGLDLKQIGTMGGIGGIIGTIATFAVASIGSSYVDKWHPVRTTVFLGPLVGLTYAYACKYFFLTPPVRVYCWMSVILVQVIFLNRFTGIAGMPFLMKTLPKSRFGQFCSARSLVSSLLAIFFGLLLGAVVDFLKYNLKMGDYAYRAIDIWMLLFFVLSMLFRVLAFLEYKKLGGYNGFKAPAVWEKSGYETMDISKAQDAEPKWLKIILYCFDGVFVLSSLSVLVLAYRARMIGAIREVEGFLSIVFPITIGILIFWLFIHKIITGRIRKYQSGECVSMPHHGLLLLIMVMRLLLIPSFFLQGWMTLGELKPDSGMLAAIMTGWDISMDFIIVAMIWLFTVIEIPIQKEKTVNQD